MAEILSRAPRRSGGPYYIRFEPPSNCGKRVRTVHRSLRTNVVAAAKALAKLIIEPILNGQWETAEKLKSKSGYSTIGDIIGRYQLNAEDRPATIRNNSVRFECSSGLSTVTSLTCAAHRFSLVN
jgi:hypothetical protein